MNNEQLSKLNETITNLSTLDDLSKLKEGLKEIVSLSTQANEGYTLIEEQANLNKTQAETLSAQVDSLQKLNNKLFMQIPFDANDSGKRVNGNNEAPTHRSVEELCNVMEGIENAN